MVVVGRRTTRVKGARPVLNILVPADMCTVLPGAATDLLDVVIEDVENYALARIPELGTVTLSPGQESQIKSVFRVAVKRYVDAGDGSVTFQAAPGGYSQSVDGSGMRRGGLLYERELATLRAILGIVTGSNMGKAMLLGGSVTHAAWCSINFGAACDCPVNNPWRSW